jgi:hypothetical protein
MPVQGMDKFKHYVNLDKVEDRFRQLLHNFEFSTIKDYLNTKKDLL